jgi:hypothetical protein
MNMFKKASTFAVMAMTVGVVAPVSASNAGVNVAGLSAVATQVAVWIAGEVQSRLTKKFTVASPLATLDGNHMTIVAKRLPDAAPLHGLSGPRRKHP